MVIEAPVEHRRSVKRAALAAVPRRDDRYATGHQSTTAERKLGILRRTGLFGDNLKGCVIERACMADDLRQAYQLVHDVFLGRGFISPDPSRMRVRIYETTPETATFIAKVDDRVVAVLSVVEDSPDLGLPSDCAFKDELDALRRAGRRLCEVTNQAVAEDYRKSAVPTELMRCAIAVSLTGGYHEAIAAVSPSHNGFYDLLGFRQIGAQRSYSKNIDDPVIALSMDIDQYRTPQTGLSAAAQFIRQFLTDGNRFLSRVSEWADEARRQFLKPDLLKQLFVLEKNVLARFAPSELGILHRRWGHETFAAVTADMFMPIYGERHRSSAFRATKTGGNAYSAGSRPLQGSADAPSHTLRNSRTTQPPTTGPEHSWSSGGHAAYRSKASAEVSPTQEVDWLSHCPG
jgi:ribosomal protein S18 acetylase RimI-like enzyme